MIVGIDPSMSATAVVCGPFTKKHGGSEIRSCVFKSKPSGDLPRQRIARFMSLTKEITSYIRSFEITPVQSIFIEGYSFGSKNTRAHASGEYGGILRWGLLELSEVIEVPPSCLKQFATGKGNCDKTVVAASLAQRYDVSELRTNDEYDAYALWRLGCVAKDCLPHDTAFQKEAARKVMSKT